MRIISLKENLNFLNFFQKHFFSSKKFGFVLATEKNKLEDLKSASWQLNLLSACDVTTLLWRGSRGGWRWIVGVKGGERGAKGGGREV